MENLPDTLRDRAISAAQKGYAVFPVKVSWTGGEVGSGDKIVQPIAAWPTVSTTDLAKIRAWWGPTSPWRTAQVGIDCGASGVVVVDLDPEREGKEGDGLASWAALAVEPYPFAPVATPSGGRHLYYRADRRRRVGNSQSKIGPGIDVRGEGGFVFAWGWAAKPSDLPDLPEIVHDMSGAPRPEPVAVEAPSGPATGAPDIANGGDLDPFAPAGRTFTAAEAQDFIEPYLEAVRTAKVGTINGKVNDAATVLSHFGAFWSVDDRMAMLTEALEPTAYDGKTWKVERFRRIIDGSEPVRDPWQAIHVEPTVTDEAPETPEDDTFDTAAEPDGGDTAAEPVAEDETETDKGMDAAKAVGSGYFTDAKLAAMLAAECLLRRYICTPGLGWLGWDGTRWVIVAESVPTEAIRRQVILRFDAALARARREPERVDMAVEWKKAMSASRIAALVRLARGLKGVAQADASLDANPDLLNTPAGVVDLRTGEVRPHDPALFMTKITRGSYVPGAEHQDWKAAMEAVTADAREWFQTRVGQAVTGHPVPDGRLVVMQGGGSNGKSLLTTDGIVPALGDYAAAASHKLFAASRGSEHSTERADLKGRRFLIAEELTEGRAIDVQALKQIMDVGQITARQLYRDNVTFAASHSLFVTTNYVPVVAETDHGTWRRLALLRFRYRFVRPELAEAERERMGGLGAEIRVGDVGLKARLRDGGEGRHDAIVTWAVEGARRWYAGRMEGDRAMDLPASVVEDTALWRVSADRVLGYLSERVVAAQGSCVLADELAADFNDWLASGGHNPWSREMIKSRFEGHETVAATGVALRRTRDLSGLVRRPTIGPDAPTPVQARVWVGLRFRMPDEPETNSSDDRMNSLVDDPDTE